MKTQDDVRAFILQKSQEVADSKGALAMWSQAIGRNAAYLHQFIHRGSPRKLGEDDRAKLAVEMGVDEAELTAGQVTGPPPGQAKFLRTAKHKFFVKEWREFMGSSEQAGAKAAGLDLDEYGAFETYPINFTLWQIVALAEEFGIRGDQFWFPPPKGKPTPISPPPAAKKQARK